MGVGSKGIRLGVDHRGWGPPDRVERSGRTERCASESGEVRVTGTLSGDRRQVLDHPGVGAGPTLCPKRQGRTAVPGRPAEGVSADSTADPPCGIRSSRCPSRVPVHRRPLTPVGPAPYWGDTNRDAGDQAGCQQRRGMPWVGARCFHPCRNDPGIGGIADGLTPSEIPEIHLSMVEALSGAASAVALVIHSSR